MSNALPVNAGKRNLQLVTLANASNDPGLTDIWQKKPKPGKARRGYSGHPPKNKFQNKPMAVRQERKKENMANRTSEQLSSRLQLRDDPHNAQALEMFNNLPQTPNYKNHTIAKHRGAVRLSRAAIEDPRLGGGDSVAPSLPEGPILPAGCKCQCIWT
jgi:hypothetical protein